MIAFRALASALMASVLGQAKKNITNAATSLLLQQAQSRVRTSIIEHVTERYSKEVEHNVSEYIQALGKAEVEVKFQGRPGEAIISRAESAFKELELYIQKQNPDGPVIEYLQRRYKEEGIRIITGRLYAGHLIKNTGQGTYEIMNKMGYATAVDQTRPWLTGEETAQGIGEMIAKAASDIFERTFDGVDLSDDMAALYFIGEIEKEYSQFTSGRGFGSFKQIKNSSKKKKRRK